MAFTISQLKRRKDSVKKRTALDSHLTAAILFYSPPPHPFLRIAILTMFLGISHQSTYLLQLRLNFFCRHARSNIWSRKWRSRCPRRCPRRYNQPMSVISANNDSSVYGRQVAGTRGQIFGQGNGVHDVLGDVLSR